MPRVPMIAMRIEPKATIDTCPGPRSAGLPSWRKMSDTKRHSEIWLIGPVSHAGMAYSGVGQVDALARLGASALLVGSECWVLDPAVVPRITVFRGTHGSRSAVHKGIAYVT